MPQTPLLQILKKISSLCSSDRGNRPRMDQNSYQRRKWLTFEPSRPRCNECRRPRVTCYCESLKPFHSYPQFVFLMHPEETRKKIATGRMSHRMISNSFLFEGIDFTNHTGVNRLLQDPRFEPALLYAGPSSVDISQRSLPSSPEITPLIIVLDGTWSWAKSMYKRSKNLQRLPTFRFTPKTKSQFLVRKQPADYCYSTIEAVHYVISHFGAQSCRNEHDRLLSVFRGMVNKQLSFEHHGRTASRKKEPHLS